jgi:hypothetical protein
MDLNDHEDSLRGLMLQALGLDVEIAGRVERRLSNGRLLSAHDLTARQNRCGCMTNGAEHRTLAFAAYP